MIYSNSKRIDLERQNAEIIELKDRIFGYQETIKSLQGSLKSAEAAKERQKTTYESKIAEKDAIIKELCNKLAHMAAVNGRDGTNTGTSTASVPINKKKHIPNSRRGSNKTKGGQPGHERHVMAPFEAEEITETTPHELNISDETCERCGGGFNNRSSPNKVEQATSNFLKEVRGTPVNHSNQVIHVTKTEATPDN